jgi:hypothetical protein
VIGRLTDTSMAAMGLGLSWEQLAWPQEQGEYDRLREEALQQFGQIGLGDVALPDTQEKLAAEREELSGRILEALRLERGRVLGDTVALPLFFLQSFSLRAALNMGLELEDTGELGLIEDCLEDLGLDRGRSEILERESGWIFLFEGDSPETTTVRRADVIKASGSFVVQVLEEFGRREEGIEGLAAQLQGLQATVEEFREEQRDANERVEKLIREGNEELRGLLLQVQEQLVAEGVDEEEAKQLTEADPKTFWERLLRWRSSAAARDAAEAALWVALDFVPGGTGVKLGIKIAGAVRRSLKASAAK